jgi:hypothetical protein
MPDVSSIAALDVLIGLFFLYFLLSLVCSAINEAISQVFNLRAVDLKRGLRNLLVEENAVDNFYRHWRIDALFKPKILGLAGRRKPSYIPSRAFALTVLDTFAGPVDGVANWDLIGRAHKSVDQIQNPRVKLLVKDALDEARLDIDKFRMSLERSFNEVMDRASGWYKRRVQLFLFVIAVALVGAMNADTFTIAERLWKDDALRAAVAAQAQNQTSVRECAEADEAAEEPNSVDRAAACIDRIEALGLPLGWTDDTTPEASSWTVWEGEWLRTWGAKFLGLLVTAFALSLGAPFWFDLLSKVSRLRATGPREVPSDEEARATSAPAETRPSR